MWRSLSLTSRLTFFFTAVAAALVLALGYLFMQAAEEHFVDLDRSALSDKKQLIEGILANAKSADDARWRLNESLMHHHGLFVRVADTTGFILFQSKNPLPSSHGVLTSNSRDPDQHDAGQNGSTYRSTQFKTTPAFDSAGQLDVFMAIDTEHHQEFLDKLRRSLAIYAVIAMLVSGLLGWFAAHQGMAPLRAMKARAAGVSGQQMNTRMPVGAVPIEMAELATELNRMLDRLRQDFQRLSDFSSDLAHELRTPVSNLLTQTQVTLSARRDEGTYREILASNAEELQRLARMVSDMLFLAKTERGVDLPSMEKFAVAHEVQALLEFYEAVAEEKRVQLSVHGEGSIAGDRLMFRRAISNLLSNALRHTPDGGGVKVIITESQRATEVTVENTGRDIDPRVLPRLFDRFYRAEPARSHPESDGAGLGLSITKAIAEAHGGAANASSQGGKTQFTLTFPHSGAASCSHLLAPMRI